MFKLPVRTWILNAAAVFSGHHGAVTRQAEQAGCSRQTVYQHAHKLEQRLGAEPAAEPPTEERPRPEAVAAGVAKIVGTNRARIVAETETLLKNPEAYERMSRAISPYGDGHAAERIVAHLASQLERWEGTSSARL